jgi:hypothetical protein
MTLLPPLPHYENAALAAMSAPGLLNLLLRDEDRAPRNVIDECARRGEAMVELLREVLAQGRGWDNDDEGENENGQWWLLHHAVMILGLIPEQSAGVLLTQYMRRMDEAVDEDLLDWLSGRWPALFRNKPASVLPVLRAICEDRELDWYVRSDAMESIVAYAQREDAQALDAALDWAARLAADENEDWDLRFLTGSTLLSFAPPRHRALLDDLADQQAGIGATFTASDVTEVYATGGEEKPWEQRFADPWAFYAPAAIEARQQRWAEEDALPAALGVDDAAWPETFVRQGPKIGRNDPCPCGSGKKYKKCCMPA